MGGSHHTNPTRRKSGVSSVLQRKTLAQAEFTSAEQVNSPKGERPKGANPQKSHDLSRGFLWWTRSDSNRRPPQCECDALPAALLAHSSAYWRNKFIIAQLPPLCNAKTAQIWRFFVRIGLLAQRQGLSVRDPQPGTVCAVPSSFTTYYRRCPPLTQPRSAARTWSMRFCSVSACFFSVMAPTMGSPTILPLRSTT